MIEETMASTFTREKKTDKRFEGGERRDDDDSFYGDNNDDLGSTYGLSLRSCSIDGNTGTIEPLCDCSDIIRTSSCIQYYVEFCTG